MALSSSLAVRSLADQLDRSIHGGAWHGPATGEVLAGIDAALADRHLDGFPHTIAELVRHITFWLDAAYLRIVDGRDVDSRNDWPVNEKLTEQAWTRIVADLEQAHTKLHHAVLDLEEGRLDDAAPGSAPTVRGLLLGVLQHNAYHTGQIVQLARELAT